MTQAAAKSMTVDEFLAWAEGREGRYELHDGEIVAMSPVRSVHSFVKGAVTEAFRSRLRAAGVPCRAFVDGALVKVGETMGFQPDLVVECGGGTGPNDVIVANPFIVVEVLSPSTRRYDTNTKLAGYFQVPSIRHYLIVDPDRRRATLHTKQEGGAIATSIHAEGSIAFDPPGVSVELAAFFED